MPPVMDKSAKTDIGISIQESLSGYSLFTPKVTLVPKQFFKESQARAALEDVAALLPDDRVAFEPVPEYGAVMVYALPAGKPEGDAGKVLPELWYVLSELSSCGDYNKILCSWREGWLNIAVARGCGLLLANVFRAADFTTAQYYIYMVVKKLQLNPEQSSICFRTPLDQEQEMSLYRYFKAVEFLSV